MSDTVITATHRFVFTATPEVTALVAGRQLTIPPSIRKLWVRSRLVITDNGTVPLLQLIAEQKFKLWEKHQYPIWTDRDWTNESFDNVSLATDWVREGPARKRSKYGKAGTPEYHIAYRNAHREKAKEYQRKRYARVKEALAAQRAATQASMATSSVEEKAFAAQLESILGPLPDNGDDK